jgi:ATP-binding cassette subfamily B protein
VLGFYNIKILVIFAIGSFLSIVWTFLFNKQRRSIDYRNFQQMADNTEKMHEIIHGMPEIKLNSFESFKRWEWQNSQIKLFKIRISDLNLQQYQELGSNFLTQLKNVIITYIAAYGVVKGDLTFGAMLSISYMTGQLNMPIERIKTFFVSLVSVRFSLERMAEVHEKADEEKGTSTTVVKEYIGQRYHNGNESIESQDRAHGKGVTFRKLDFQYEGPKSPFVLKNVDLEIPLNRVTAIVGSSGSGKTTLMKLMLKFYEPIGGSILLNGVDLSRVSPKAWRSQCGVVMQDGYIFSDTIARNIAMADDEAIDFDRVHDAARAANIHTFVDGLPLGYNTKIGKTGNGISAGQKQRLLIARAVYKNPSFLFFDEATSALDANNEKIIVSNLDTFFQNKTVVVIAHRLSTVKNADNLIVLDNGEIVEVGNHTSLVSEKGIYFNLVKNQLELGN